ncbi:hypothetical protein V2S66_25215 [Streptomyces sp. V4-01]|uniref:PLD phosphodiesterase domain-containing protein n=1 Tax=Actinacidiphila polyblastidii TaxID=3110430 RepID=A0ABU7PJM9_9ACTN|nr:hypothetical protein [Streptomyces sp. V4-01]
MGAITIGVRCTVIQVRATLGYGRYVSPIELIVLKALTLNEKKGLREATPYGTDELAGMLGLGRQLTLDVISDLWHKGYVTVDLAHGQVRAAAAVREHALAGTLQQMEGAEEYPADYQLMVDGLSGTLLPFGGTTRPPSGTLQVPLPAADFAATDFTQDEVVDALHETLRHERRGHFDRQRGRAEPPPDEALGREKRVLTAHVVPPLMRGPAGHQWLTLSLTVSRDRDNDRLQMSITDSALPVELRARMVEHIEALVDAAPGQDPFAKAVRGAAESSFRKSLSLESELDRFERTLTDVALARPGTHGDRQNDLADQARRLGDLLSQRVAAEVDAEVVSSPAEHEAALTDLIRLATRQLVISCPVLGYEPLHDLLEALRGALDKEVEVVLLWGDHQRSTLPPPVANMLDELAAFAKGRLIWSRRPHRVNGCVVVADDRHALVTGFPFLAPEPSRRGRTGRDPRHRALQMGLRIDAPGPGACEPIEALLRWARRAVPDYRMSRKVRTRRSEFQPPAWADRGPDPDLPPQDASPWRPHLPDVPVAPQGADGGPATDADVDLWREAWEQYAAALRRELRGRERPWAAALLDGAHQDALWEALRKTSTRLIVSSALIGPDAFDSRFVRELEQRLDRNVSVTLAHGRQTETTGTATVSRKLLSELRESYRDRGLTLLSQATNARVLVADLEVVVGSFDLLSMGWPSAGSVNRRPSEVGLRLVDLAPRQPTLQRVVQHVLGAEPDGPGPEPEAARDDAPALVEAPTATAAQRLLGRLAALPGPAGSPAGAAVVRETVDLLTTEPGAVVSLLDTLRGHPDRADVLRVAAAHALRRHDLGDDAPRWHRWLLQDRWQCGAYLEAYVLRAALDRAETRPRLSLCLAALKRGGEGFDSAIATAALETDELLAGERPGAVAEAAALTCLCADEVLLGERRAAAREALGLLEPALAGPWRELAVLTRGHYDAGLGAVPVLQLSAELDDARYLDALRASWELLERRLSRAEAVTFRFVSGIRTHAALFHADGVYGRLRAHLDDRNTSALREWSAAHPVENVDRELDDTTLSLNSVQPLPVMMAGQRRNFVARLVEVHTAAVELVGLLNAARPTAGGELARQFPTAQALGALLPELREAATRLDGRSERALVDRALDELSDFAAWGEGR